ncbi:actin-like ATPase domain-containing protein [Thozetella sp. PMI_491]|nr:actin-like ATPase domain-containing protein [Thozetella sp. PMI_491]
MANPDLNRFLTPLHIDTQGARDLARDLAANFKQLSAESLDQFLPTPISESMLRPSDDLDRGSGGTNLRVAFVDLSGGERAGARRLLEQKWPIQEHLKHENSVKLFDWIGERVARVVRAGLEAFVLPRDVALPMGITFSFPMSQRSLSEANLMAMGKGFAITSNLDLGGHLLQGYEQHRAPDMPPIRIAAISNDAVSTLVSFIYQFPERPHRKAAMGLIVGTGSNATIPLRLRSLHPSKRPHAISVIEGQDDEDDIKIAVNTEWSIKGSMPPLKKAGLISRWDEELSAATELPGFQPLEYMTAGRYLGELARLVFVDYITNERGVQLEKVPEGLRQKFKLSTTFISFFYPGSAKGPPLAQLNEEFPTSGDFVWAEEHADALYHIAHAIEVRAAGIVAAAVVGLLVCAEELSLPEAAGSANGVGKRELAVGYTGGCIQFFQNYLEDCQGFLDGILSLEFDGHAPVRVVLSPCHDGGIMGAGILVPAALASHKA